MTPTHENYDEDYFLRGKESGKSLYENYRWLPELTIPMVERIVEHCGINRKDTILDFGCARGYTVKALRMLEYNAWGYDVSKWAIHNCDPDVKDYVSLRLMGNYPIEFKYDWIIAKDVLEHVHYVQRTVDNLMDCTKIGLFIVVPVCEFDTAKYTIPEYEMDITHCQRHTLSTWAKMFLRPGWSVEMSYRVKGIKDNYAQYPTGNGFLTIRRLEE